MAVHIQTKLFSTLNRKGFQQLYQLVIVPCDKTGEFVNCEPQELLHPSIRLAGELVLQGGVDLRDDGDIDNDMRDFTFHSAKSTFSLSHIKPFNSYRRV